MMSGRTSRTARTTHHPFLVLSSILVGRAIKILSVLTDYLQNMNCFIEQKDVDEDEWNLVFRDSIDGYYDKASEAPIKDDGSPDSPFIGKTPQECHQLLLKLLEDTESEIMTDYFAIMDDLSTQDDTVLLVCAERDPENEALAWPTIRLNFQASAVALML
ncbi:hypothetical protein N7523_008777 [Penicillium sp. IBT 18751x]|nr:hypothetical protein N7523_008777 [Penicillium sp. IBT 18751x]